ncbi:hypothetical protein ABW21_db0200551 [Orbilia brochopaga]|nr:hypothetical protein ABW21_db0200551 [Drechslerella brochopaga]
MNVGGILLKVRPASASGSHHCLHMLRAYGRPQTPAYGYRLFNATAAPCKKQMPPRPKVNEDDLEEKFLKGTYVYVQTTSIDFNKIQDSHPNGENKTSSAVQLRHIPTGIVVKSQETRSREQNRKIARQLLASKLEDIEKGDQSRNNVLKQVANKKKASKRKKSLRKYRKLDDAKTGDAGQLEAGDNAESDVAGELEAGEEFETRLEEEEGEEAESEDEEGNIREPAGQTAESNSVIQPQNLEADGLATTGKPGSR